MLIYSVSDFLKERFFSEKTILQHQILERMLPLLFTHALLLLPMLISTALLMVLMFSVVELTEQEPNDVAGSANVIDLSQLIPPGEPLFERVDIAVGPESENDVDWLRLDGLEPDHRLGIRDGCICPLGLDALACLFNTSCKVDVLRIHGISPLYPPFTTLTGDSCIRAGDLSSQLIEVFNHAAFSRQ